MRQTHTEEHERERRAYADFASRHAEPVYREPLAELYPTWRGFNTEYFGARLVEPHLDLDRTASRSLGHFAPVTGYGGHARITFNAGLVLGTNAELVVNPLPADGTRRFIDDLLLRFSAQQYVSEVEGTDEEGYRGFGPRAAAVMTGIGLKLGLAPVVARNRGTGDLQPVASDWPHNVRPAGYYGDDVTERALDLARGISRTRRGRAAPSLGLLELLHYLLVGGRTTDAERLVARHLNWVRRARESRWPPRRRVEGGKEHVDGTPLDEVVVDAGWLTWNGGTVRRLAEGVLQAGAFEDLPILADALEEAGCRDARILLHLRAEMEHGPRCWVLRLLHALDEG
jgi:hypothetical protein